MTTSLYLFGVKQCQEVFVKEDIALLNFMFFVTKYRRKVFTKAIFQDLKIMFSKICCDFDSELIELDGEHDHVYLLINYPPKVSISKLVNSLKGASSRMIRKKGYATIQKAL